MEQFKNQEVFIVTGSETDDRSELFVTDQQAALDEYLLLKDPVVDESEDVRVFHGVLTLAEFLPSSFHGKSAFLVIQVPDKLDEGCVVEASESPDMVAQEIEAVLQSADPLTYGDLTIDHIFILYGYQLSLGLAVNPENMDDECILTCETIAANVEEVEETLIERQNGGEDG